MNNLTVVILSFNTKEITEKAIELALTSAKYCEENAKNSVDIIVVDNGSSDGSVEMIKKFPVKLIALPENIGAARGYNEGMKSALGEYILLINNDTYLYEDTLFQAVSYAEKNHCDVLTGRLAKSEDLYLPFGGFLPTPFRVIRWVCGFESLPLPMKRIYVKDSHFFEKEQKLGWTPTCFLFITREVYEKTQGHDENMFFYMEDVEWCKRINDAGFTISYTPSFTIIHLGGKSTQDKWKALRLLQHQTSGLLYYINKHYPTTSLLVLSFMFLGYRLRSLFYFLIGQKDLAHAYSHVKFVSNATYQNR